MQCKLYLRFFFIILYGLNSNWVQNFFDIWWSVILSCTHCMTNYKTLILIFFNVMLFKSLVRYSWYQIFRATIRDKNMKVEKCPELGKMYGRAPDFVNMNCTLHNRLYFIISEMSKFISTYLFCPKVFFSLYLMHMWLYNNQMNYRTMDT